MKLLQFLLTLLLLPHFISAQCSDTLVGSRQSLGIYGGTCHDFTFSNSGTRIFAGIKSPISLIYTEDTGSTWHSVFPVDSLEYECGQRGWGGGCSKILTNQKGWFIAQTAGETLTASVVSFSNGDSASWQTAMDPYLISKVINQPEIVQTIALSEFYLFTACNAYIVKQDSSLKIDSINIVDVRTLIPGASTYSTIHVLALGSDSSGLPIYFAMDTLGIGNSINKGLYKFDGDTILKVNLPSNLNGIDNVFTISHQLNGDTVFISGIDTTNNYSKLFRSYDGGSSWKEILNNPITTTLSDIDYSQIWKNIIPNSEGNILLAEGDYVYISIDLGDTWKAINGSIFGLAAISPLDTNLVMAANPMNSWRSLNGPSGGFGKNIDMGFDAITVNNIAVSPNKTVVYLATNIGLGYTTAYTNSNVVAEEKWKGTNGQFPVNLDSIINAEISCVKIDKKDSSHVIAGIVQYGIAVTSSGPTGFTLLSPFDKDNEPVIKDIEFITSSVVLAVTNIKDISFTPTGNIWRSADGGYTWVKVSPIGFNCGNSIAVGYANNDTTIYVGSGFDITNPGHLWTSKDLGLTWVKVNDGPNAFLDTTAKKLPILDIEINPNDNDSIYIAAGSINNNYAFVQSIDGGITYHYITVNASKTFNAVLIKKSSADTILAANGREIFLYDVKNDTSTLIFRAYPGESIPDLANGSILAGTSTGFYGILYDETADIVSIESLSDSKNKLSLFPNPASSYLGIRTENTGDNIIEIYNMVGRLLKTERKNGNNENVIIDVNGLPNGMFLIKVKSKTDELYAKFLINHE